jgi:hypothetical protein
MIPAIAILGIGRTRRPRIPLPLFLLWPFVALAWLIIGLISLCYWIAGKWGRGPARARTILLMFCRLSGTVVDIRAQDGTQLYVRLI